ARHADRAALERLAGELLLQVRIFGAAGAVEVLAVTGLGHEAVDDTVERHVVVVAVAGELLDPLGMLRCDVGAQRDHDAALGGVDHDGIVLVEIGGKLLSKRGRGQHQRGKDGENSDHANSDRHCEGSARDGLILAKPDATFAKVWWKAIWRIWLSGLL